MEKFGSGRARLAALDPLQRLKLAVEVASVKHAQLKTMSVLPHIVRHSTAMSLLHHESPSTTHMYVVEADLAIKERSLARLKQPEVKQAR